ncbi:MAG: hypothetical protein ACRDIB_19045, partial [Ardenticatenaceae bacterium]
TSHGPRREDRMHAAVRVQSARGVTDIVRFDQEETVQRVLPGMQYARRTLPRLLHSVISNEIDVTRSLNALNSAMAMLSESLEPDSIYPTLSIGDDGEVYAEWRAGRRRISVEIDGRGARYMHVTDDEGRVVYDGEEEHGLRRHLKGLTALVTEANPNWHTLF